MSGPCSKVHAAGHCGKRKGNVARDIHRKFIKMAADEVPRHIQIFFFVPLSGLGFLKKTFIYIQHMHSNPSTDVQSRWSVFWKAVSERKLSVSFSQ